MAASNDTGHLKTQAHELVKQHIEYDLQSRVEYVYTVRQDAADQTPCSVVRYSYDGTSSRVVYMKEYTGTWDSAWETF
jgi:hypothetical protein